MKNQSKNCNRFESYMYSTMNDNEQTRFESELESEKLYKEFEKFKYDKFECYAHNHMDDDEREKFEYMLSNSKDINEEFIKFKAALDAINDFPKRSAILHVTQLVEDVTNEYELRIETYVDGNLSKKQRKKFEKEIKENAFLAKKFKCMYGVSFAEFKKKKIPNLVYLDKEIKTPAIPQGNHRRDKISKEKVGFIESIKHSIIMIKAKMGRKEQLQAAIYPVGDTLTADTTTRHIYIKPFLHAIAASILIIIGLNVSNLCWRTFIDSPVTLTSINSEENYGPPINYTNYNVEVISVKWHEPQDIFESNCFEFTKEEYSGILWLNDNLNSTKIGGDCTITPNIIIGSRDNACVEAIDITFEGFENDNNEHISPSIYQDEYDDNAMDYLNMQVLTENYDNIEGLAGLSYNPVNDTLYSVEPNHLDMQRKSHSNHVDKIPSIDVTAMSIENNLESTGTEFHCNRYEDSLGLIALYNATNGVDWTISWDLNRPLDSWYGLEVNQSGCIISLDLSNNGLNGTIPLEIENLSELAVLNLGDNQLSDTIPSEIGNLKQLAKLFLDKNILTGNIPSNLGNLTSLTSLYLNHNNISGIIPPEFGNLINLAEIYLYSNELNGSIPPEIGNLTNLKEIKLYNNQLSGNIPPEIGNLNNLLCLDLSSNELSGSIPPKIGNLNNLRQLYLRDNQLSGCYDENLLNLCNELSPTYNINSLISEGNNFNAPWEDFCTTAAGVCGDLVLPGDFNSDRIINKSDLIYWSLTSGFTGFKRLDVTTAFEHQEAYDWQEVLFINGKHQDSNGNATINKHLEASEKNINKQNHDISDVELPKIDVTDMKIGSDNHFDADAVTTEVHWAMEETYNYLLDTFGIDCNDAPLLSWVHYGDQTNNAYWNGSWMLYGDGDSISFTSFTSLDIVAHEIIHGLIDNTSNLIYEGESDALNDSYSDIFGEVIERYNLVSNDWIIGADFTLKPGKNGLRNMANPNDPTMTTQQPDTYLGDYYMRVGSADYGGVHTNNDIQNHWFYLLSEGGTETNDNDHNINQICDNPMANLIVIVKDSDISQTNREDDSKIQDNNNHEITYLNTPEKNINRQTHINDIELPRIDVTTIKFRDNSELIESNIPEEELQKNTYKDLSIAGHILYDSDNKSEEEGIVLECENRNVRSNIRKPQNILHEVVEIDKVGKQIKLKTNLFPADTILEDTVQYFVGKHTPNIIHFATHGVFLPPSERPHYKDDDLTGTHDRLHAANNPLQRSTLILYGANETWTKGTSLISSDKDSILLSSEVITLDSLNTSLVVLSACNTGIGNIQNDEELFTRSDLLSLYGFIDNEYSFRHNFSPYDNIKPYVLTSLLFCKLLDEKNMMIISNGNVGIGTTKLTLKPDIHYTPLIVEGIDRIIFQF